MAIGGLKKLAIGKVSQSKSKGKDYVNELASAFNVTKKVDKSVNKKIKALV